MKYPTSLLYFLKGTYIQVQVWHRERESVVKLFYALLKQIKWPTQPIQCMMGRLGVLQSSIQELSYILIGSVFRHGIVNTFDLHLFETSILICSC